MRAVRRGLIVAGTLVLGYGLAGAVATPGVLIFLAAVLIAHDAVLLPLMIGAGALILRRCPPRLKPAVAGALTAAASITVVGVPLLLGPGDGHYGRGLLITYAVIAAAATLTALARRRPAPHPPTRPPRRKHP
ncbi:hypothetical protein [Actinoplanes sp. RD1]|uniref:hypothetical protein n=1 Tax=Actinoplanes sp. RD1 TaxID=3064538 RepID=UPI0027416CFB|nr:hypothetical protein [Actinoplanes sp. RD1]